MTDDPLPSIWGFRLLRLRKEAGLTQDALAEAIGTTKATISKMERSTKRPSYEWAERLAPALAVSVADVMGIEGSAKGKSAEIIPVIGMIAAGNWREAIQEPDGQIPIVDARPHMFALQVDGDSIDRIAPSGSFVAIDPAQSTRLVEGALYAVQNGEGEATLKVFRSNPDRLEPDSTNPVHQPILLGAAPVTIIGRATSVVRML